MVVGVDIIQGRKEMLGLLRTRNIKRQASKAIRDADACKADSNDRTGLGRPNLDCWTGFQHYFRPNDIRLNLSPTPDRYSGRIRGVSARNGQIVHRV